MSPNADGSVSTVVPSYHLH